MGLGNQSHLTNKVLLTYSGNPGEKKREQDAYFNRMLALLSGDVVETAWGSHSSVPFQLLILAENLCVHIC